MEFTCKLVRDHTSFAAISSKNCAATDAVNAGSDFVTDAKGWAYERIDDTSSDDYLIARFSGPDNNGAAIYHQDVDHWNRALARHGVKVEAIDK